MIYRNTKTGIEFETKCECKGADIMPVSPAPQEKPAEAKPKRRTTKK